MKSFELTSAAFARAITSDAPPSELVDALRKSPEQSEKVLEELARHRDPIVRAWVPGVARTVFEEAAVPLILRLAREDRDPDVQDEAIDELLEVDRQAALTLVPMLRKKLQSSDPFQPLTAMWALAAIGDKASIELIRAKIAGRQHDALDRITGEVAIMLLTNPSDILRLLREHDHERIPWLAKAARLLRTAESVEALRLCAAGAPDSQCRDQCREELERLEAKRIVTEE